MIATGKLGWGWADGTALRSHVAAVSGSVFTRNADNSLESGIVQGSWDAEAKNNAVFGIAATFDRENVAENFPLSADVTIPAGNYSFVSGTAYYSSPTDQRFAYSPQFTAGQYFGGNRVAPALSLDLRATEHVVLNGSYS